jgi:hypothetical protein
MSLQFWFQCSRKSRFLAECCINHRFLGHSKSGERSNFGFVAGMNDAMTGLAEQSCCLGEAGAQ